MRSHALLARRSRASASRLREESRLHRKARCERSRSKRLGQLVIRARWQIRIAARWHLIADIIGALVVSWVALAAPRSVLALTLFRPQVAQQFVRPAAVRQ